MKQIPLTQGKFAMVDDSDFEWLNQWKWYAKKCGCKWYAYRCVRSLASKTGYTTIAMHTLIMHTPEQMQVDHIDGNGFNNQKGNLRICTPSENSCYKTRHKNKYKGVRKLSKKSWIAYITHNKKSIYLGSFGQEQQAAEAYNRAARMYHNEFASLNFL